MTEADVFCQQPQFCRETLVFHPHRPLGVLVVKHWFVIVETHVEVFVIRCFLLGHLREPAVVWFVCVLENALEVHPRTLYLELLFYYGGKGCTE